jgi:hypothetical protein
VSIRIMAARRATNVTKSFIADPRKEPGALAAHAGICAGGEEKSSSYRDRQARLVIEADSYWPFAGDGADGAAGQSSACSLTLVQVSPPHMNPITHPSTCKVVDDSNFTLAP